MELTILGTGSPIPTLERAGTALVVELADEPVLIDCGPGAVYGLIEAEIDPGDVRTCFFTHHHVDHNAAFFHFAIASWTLGRESLRVFGPDGTGALLDALESVYAEDIAYRKQLGYDAGGIEDVSLASVSDGFDRSIRGGRVRAMPVSHSIETVAYRFDADDGGSVVFSGDTGELSEMAAFARDADVLVHDAGIGPVDADAEPEGLVWSDYLEPMEETKRSSLESVHCDAGQCGRIAAEAGVDTLVLTHILPYRDTDAMRRAAERAFDGEVIVASDGLGLTV